MWINSNRSLSKLYDNTVIHGNGILENNINLPRISPRLKGPAEDTFDCFLSVTFTLSLLSRHTTCNTDNAHKLLYFYSTVLRFCRKHGEGPSKFQIISFLDVFKNFGWEPPQSPSRAFPLYEKKILFQTFLSFTHFPAFFLKKFIARKLGKGGGSLPEEFWLNHETLCGLDHTRNNTFNRLAKQNYTLDLLGYIPVTAHFNCEIAKV